MMNMKDKSNEEMITKFIFLKSETTLKFKRTFNNFYGEEKNLTQCAKIPFGRRSLMYKIRRLSFYNARRSVNKGISSNGTTN